MSGASPVVSLRCDRHGCVGALVERDGRLAAVARARHPPVTAWAGFHAIAAEAVLAAVHGVLAELAAAADGRAPAAIGVTTPRATALLVGSENRWCSPVLFGESAPLPAREVPSEFAAVPRLAGIYRRSVVRQVTEREPDAALELRRVVSLGALVYRELSGYWTDAVACAPGSVPLGGQHAGGYADDEAAWLAAGIDARGVPTLVPPGGVAAQLAAPVARRYGWTAGTPLVATSDALGCMAYGLKSDAAAWVVELGDGVRAGWCAQVPESDPERYSIQIVEPGAGAVEEGVAQSPQPEPEPRPLTLEEASAAVAARLGALASVAPGPRAGLERFELSTVEGLFDAGAGALYRESGLRIETAFQPLVGPAMLSSVPLGCDGLRVVAGRGTAALVGLRPAHGQAHLVRAALEGLALELGRWRLSGGVLGADVPRIVVTRPWASEVIGWVADVLGETVAVWMGEPELPALLGQALAMLRDLGLDQDASPRLRLQTVAPSERAEAYRAQRGVYLAVREALEPVLG